MVDASSVSVRTLWWPDSVLSFRTPVEPYEWSVTQSPAAKFDETKTPKVQSIKSAEGGG